MKTTTVLKTLIIIFATAAAVTFAQSGAAAAGAKKDSIAVIGVYTPLRFARGQLDDLVPDEWNLEFFSKERMGLNLLMQGMFTDLLTEDAEDMEVVQPATFERLSRDIYRKLYYPAKADAAARFVWTDAYNYCKMLNIRYAMFGDVTKFDFDLKKGTADIEMFVYIYDMTKQSVIFTQQFANKGQLSEEYSYNSLRRLHKTMDPSIINFLRTAPGRGSLTIYQDFISKFAAAEGGVIKPGEGEKNPPDTGGGTTPGDTPGDKYKTSMNCKGGGDVLILTAKNGMEMLACNENGIQTVQTADGLLQGSGDIPWPAVGEFEVRGRPMLALAPTDSWEEDAQIFSARGNSYNFDRPAFSIKDDSGRFGHGASVAAGDFDGDLKDELAVSSMNKSSIAIYKIVTGKVQVIERLENPIDGYTGGLFVAAGDINGDGSAELVVSESDGDEAVVYRRSGGKFAAAPPYDVISGIFDNYTDGCYVATGDIDGDGKDELVITKALGGSDVLIMKNINGKLAVTDEVKGLVKDYTGGLFPAAGDFDGDGRAEIVLTLISKESKAYIYRVTDGKLDATKPLAVLDGAFGGGADGMLASTGKFVPLVLR